MLVRKLRKGHLIYTQIGDLKGLESLINLVEQRNLNEAGKLLKTNPRHFGIIIESEEFIFAAVDKIRSIPILYRPKTGEASMRAHDLKPSFTRDYNKTSLLHFCMAGYVIGQETLYDELKSLQAGELLFFDKKTSKIEMLRYYQYLPCPDNTIEEDEAQELLGKTLDNSILRTLENVNGRKIWIPLSGGLDSRIVAAKIHDFGYDNFELFSYGRKNNDEAKIAREVARRLGVKWSMLPSNPREARSLFTSEKQKQYEDFSHAYCTIPSYVEFEAIHALKKTGQTSEDDFIINGQTGDYISGAHIPAILYENKAPSHRDLIDYIIDKHFSLWKSLKNPENIGIISESIKSALPAPDPKLDNKGNLIRAYESFEWAERQCKMVVHGQRVYDFFGYNWALPFWDGEIMDLFESMPLNLKYKRKLFKEHVKRYNHCKVFDLPIAAVKTWQPPALYFMVTIGKLLEIIYGDEHKSNFYKKMSYYGHAKNQFSLFEKTLYDENYKNIRNMISLSILEFCNRHNLPLTQE